MLSPPDAQTSASLERSWKLLRNFLIGLLLLFTFFMTYVAVRSAFFPKAQIQASLVGTWRGEHENILDMRADGTGRARFLQPPQNAIQYFQWSAAKGVLTIEMLPAKPSLVRRLRRLVFAETPFEYPIVTLTETELQLHDNATGETLKFVPTSDAALQTAP